MLKRWVVAFAVAIAGLWSIPIVASASDLTVIPCADRSTIGADKPDTATPGSESGTPTATGGRIDDKLVIGGGSRGFLPETTSSRRMDALDEDLSCPDEPPAVMHHSTILGREILDCAWYELNEAQTAAAQTRYRFTMDYDPAFEVVQHSICVQFSGVTQGVYFRVVERTDLVDPFILLQGSDLYETLQRRLPEPVIHIGPNPDRIAVNLESTFTVDTETFDPIHLVAGTVTVDAWITHTSTALNFGDGHSTVCGGTGGTGCMYTYLLRSLPERTDGVGEYHVTSEATYTLHWITNIPWIDGGDVDNTVTSALDTYVGEYRTVIVVPTR